MHDDGEKMTLASGLSPEELEVFQYLLRQEALSEVAPETTITPRDPSASAPLSYSQQRIWFLEAMDSGSSAYNMSAALEMNGRMHVDSLARSLEEVVRRHGTLRARFVVSEGRPQQVIHPAAGVGLPVVEISGLDERRAEEEVRRLSAKESRQPFDLLDGPLLRVTLLRLAAERHVLLVSMHHIVADGWSVGVFVRETAGLYRAFRAGEPSPLADLTLQYGDFAAWQHERLQGEAVKSGLAYWRGRLGGELPVLDLAADRPRAAAQTFRGGRCRSTLSTEVSARLGALAQSRGATLFMVLLAAFDLLLRRLTGQTDILVGTPVAGRDRRELEGLIGCFLNTLVMRTDVSGDLEFTQLLERVRETAVGAYAHQQIPFELLLQELRPGRDLSRTPFFQVFFNMLNIPEEEIRLPDLQVRYLQPPEIEAKFDLTIYAAERRGRIELECVFNAGLFDEPRMEDFLAKYERLLAQIASRPEEKISSYSLLTPRAVELVPDPTVSLEVPALPSLGEMFLEQSKRAPDAPAVACETGTWTYAGLRGHAVAVARRLIARGIEPGTVAAVCGPRSPELIGSLLGVFLSGGVLLTLDRGLPEERLRTILRQAGTRWLLYVGARRAKDAWMWAEPGIEVMPVATGEDVAPADDGSDLPAPAADAAAYVFFTSGTTGVPKGVLGRQKGLAHFLDWQRRSFEIRPGDRAAQLTGLGFDVVLRDIFLPLVAGATLCLPEGDDLSAETLFPWLEASRVTVIHTVPSLAAAWFYLPPAARPRALRWVFFAGEPLVDDIVRRARRVLSPSEGIVNLYGPTETTLAKCFYRVPDPPGLGVQPVGEALPQAQALVLGAGGVRCGIAEPGEIVIRTPFRSLGYLDAEGEAPRLRRNPFRDDPGDLLYYTGDLGRFRPDGMLEILGRLDDQVKIRGMRVEPAEVRAAVRAQAGVAECEVLARADLGEGLRLVAYVVPDSGAEIDVGVLHRHLAGLLPSYMVPYRFVALERLPLTPNGKVDRRALPRPEPGRTELTGADAEPSTAIEELVGVVWCELLELERVGPGDDFFELGGHSLLIHQLIARLRASLDVELPVRAVFESPTLRAFAERVEAARGTHVVLPALSRRRKTDSAPLSFPQERLWFFDQLEPGSTAYNLTDAVRLRGPLDVEALRRSLDEIAVRHEVLRTTYEVRGDRPVQVIAEPSPVDLTWVEASAEDVEAATARVVAQEAAKPFDLGRDAMLRAVLLSFGPSLHVLVVTMHHIASDVWSKGIFCRELAALYGAFVTGAPSPLAEPSVQYSDFALWQREWMSGEVVDEQLAFWRERLGDGPAVLELPSDRPRPAVQTFSGKTLTFAPRRPPEGLEAVGRRHGATPFMVLEAVFKAFLYRYTGQRDLSAGTPVAGRYLRETEGLIGFFVNTIVLRTRVSGRLTFAELVERERSAALDAYAYQALPFERLVAELRPERDLAHSPLFQVMLVFNAPRPRRLELPGLELEVVESATGGAKFDLTVTLTAAEGALYGYWEFNRDLFDETTVQRMEAHFENLLDGAFRDPVRLVAELPLLSPAERAELASEWNDSAFRDELETPFPVLFEEQARRWPDAVAVESEAAGLSYAELDRRAAAVAAGLRRSGVGPEVLVGICCERSPQMVAALVGVFKAGGAYVPLDPSYPRERLAYMAADAGLGALIRDPAQGDAVAGFDLPEIVLGTPSAGRPATGGEAPSSLPRAGNLAYVIYTSGSTGRPKGVAVSHRALANFLHSMRRRPGLGRRDVLLAVTTLSFDIAALEIYLPLAAGARLALTDRATAADGELLARRIREVGASVMQATPATWQMLVSSGWRGDGKLRALTGGEALSQRLAAELGTRASAVWNLYGPTETTVWSAVHEVGSHAEPIPIGRPIANTRIHLLDRDRGPVPVGVAGELLIAGEGLARGYRGRPGMTAERFVPDPFGGGPGGRLYRTGDLARRRLCGELDYLGRLDHQVKVRGFRIELAEIESVLAEHRAVGQAVATVRGDGPWDRRLTAYVVAEDPRPSADELRRHLRERLPEYMIPAQLVFLEALPLTPNRKVDRGALPAPGAGSERGYVEPRNRIEREVARIWAEALGLEEVGRHDNFFDLGGHSLLMVRVRRRLEERFGLKLAMVELFQHPTVTALAEMLSSESSAPASRWRGSGREKKLEERKERLMKASQTMEPGREIDHTGHTGLEIAIVGMAGRFPGAADLHEFWRNLAAGTESIEFFSDETLAAAGVSQELLNDPHYVKARGVLDGADLFDAEFFGYGPREVEAMDPQHRVFLECAWEAMENAGYDPTRFDGLVGVYGGVKMPTYLFNVYSHPDVISALGQQQISLNNDNHFLATRVAYKLDLKGPGMVVQTACSSSLVAVHVACQALLSRECDMALAGGVSIAFPQVAGYLHQPNGILSRDGHCRAFDAAGSGAVAGDGAGIVVLKRLEEARADGDLIHAVIRGTGVNNDGLMKAGFTAPSVEGQAKAIDTALLTAEVDPETISYVEAHGTGTEVGDPIEIAALARVFGSRTSKKAFCAIGSVKTNIGHLDTAAGIAGLIKTVLALKHARLPPSLHFEEPNPEIDFESNAFFVNRELRDWPAEGSPRRAGVSSFGLGGTNAHAVLEEPPASEPSGASWPCHLLTISARTETALDTATSNLARHLKSESDLVMADVAYTCQVGRRAFERRRALVASDLEEAVEILENRSAGRLLMGAPSREKPTVAFVFPGLGEHYAGMGRELYDAFPVFREEIDRCSRLLTPDLGTDLSEILWTGPEAGGKRGAGPDMRKMLGRGAGDVARPVRRTLFSQPALFVLEYALARLWMSWGIRPGAMLGYSLGEYVAACLAGVMRLEHALALVRQRAALIDALPAGSMLAVPCSEEDLGARLRGRLGLAAVSAPEVCVVGGPEEEVTALERELSEEGLACRRLRTAHAFHTDMMRPVARRFREIVASVELRAPEIPYLSNVTGTWIEPAQATDPEYWVRHLLQTVKFADAVGELWKEAGRVLLEVGPGQTLGSLALQHPSYDPASGQLAVASLRPEFDSQSDLAFLLKGLGQLWLAGVDVSWKDVYAGQRRHRVALPTYPFERRRYWLDRRDAAAGPADTPAKGKLADMADWFSVPSWKLSGRPLAPIGKRPTGRWLVLLDALGVGSGLAELLRSEGCEVDTLEIGDGFAKLGAQRFSIDPAGNDYERLLDSLPGAPEKVVHLWSLTPRSDPPDGLPDMASFQEAQDRGFHSLLSLAQAFGNKSWGEELEVTVVTNGLFRVERADPVRPEKATLLGPVKVLPREYPHLRCRAIDVDLDGGPETLVARLLTELLDGPDPVVAWRGTYRWLPVQEPVRLEAASRDRSPFRAEGVYLVTGGLGGIGLAVAEHLARAVKARLVLVGRSGLPPRSEWPRHEGTDDAVSRRIRKVRELEELGSEVWIAAADVSSEEQLREVIDRARDKFGGIDGVFHAAGVPGTGLVQLKTREAAASVLAPKTAGAIALDRIVASRPPDFIVHFSSTTALAGAIGQVDYCAANAFLGAIAQAAGTGTTPVVTIDWCEWQWNAWTEELGQLDPKVRAELDRHRKTFGLSFDEGLEALGRVLASGLPRVAVSTRDLGELLAEASSLEGVFEQMQEAMGRDRGGALHSRPAVGVEYVAPGDETQEILAAIYQQVLGIDRVGIHDNFFDLGGNSLLGLQLTSRIRKLCEVEVALQELFKAPTVAELASVVADNREKQRDDVAPGLLNSIDDLSEDDVDAMLAELMADEVGE